MPAKGAYLGAWVNPSQAATTKAKTKRSDPGTAPTTASSASGQASTDNKEISQLSAFNTLAGAHVQILHVFSGFTIPLPTTTLSQIVANGSIPLLDWECADVTTVATGKDDSIIKAYADSLKAFGHPVFLRWYWEMNHVGHQAGCGAGKDPATFVAAWKHIWTIFQQQKAANVAFVWCPGGNVNTAAFYPGDQYVDWIGDDHFNDHGSPSTGPAAVSNVFGAFYEQWSGHGKPMMIGATGAKPADQAGYLEGLQTALPSSYPDFKAVMYFDAPGKNGKGPWNLQDSGPAAFKSLAADPYFSFGRHT